MNIDQAKNCIEIIGELWPMVAKEPGKGGWSDRMLNEVCGRLKPFAFDSAEAILSAMRFEKASAVRPDVADLFTRLRVAADSDRRRGPVRKEAEGEHVELRSFAHWKRWHDDPERFDAIVLSMNEHEPRSGDAFASGARSQWGDQYGRESA